MRKVPYVVYVVQAPHAVKVGISADDLRARVRELGRASGHVGLVVAGAWMFPARRPAYDVEQAAHWVLRQTRLIGEWFSCTTDEALTAVERVLQEGRPLEAFMPADDAASIRAWRAGKAPQ